MSAPARSAHDFEFTAIDGAPLKLAAFAGKPILVVNTASECGLTPQYAGLQALSEKYGPRGFVVLGVPSNDFGGQEPGSEAEIKAFCAANYKVGFPMTAKNKVVGAGAHPLYAWAVAQGGEPPKWNFHKILIGADGALAGTFGSKMPPGDATLTSAIEAALAKTGA